MVVLCNFAEAYDTTCRVSLLGVMAHRGVGDAFLACTATLLHHTRACAVVDGHTSTPVAFPVRVRQVIGRATLWRHSLTYWWGTC